MSVLGNISPEHVPVWTLSLLSPESCPSRKITKLKGTKGLLSANATFCSIRVSYWPLRQQYVLLTFSQPRCLIRGLADLHGLYNLPDSSPVKLVRTPFSNCANLLAVDLTFGWFSVSMQPLSSTYLFLKGKKANSFYREALWRTFYVYFSK